MMTRNPFTPALVITGLLLIGDSAGAQSWTQTSAPSNSWHSVAISADGTRLIAVADNYDGDGLIYTSTNGGAAWFPTSAPRAAWSSVASSADGMKLVASGNAGLYNSPDYGTTWTLRTNLHFGSLAASADGTRLIGADGSPFTSTDSGATWQLSFYAGSCVASSADGTKLVTGFFAYPGQLMGGIFTSTNAGLTWTLTSAPLDYTTGWTSLASSADGMKLAATIGYTSWPTGPGPVYTSADRGNTWRPTPSPVTWWTSIAGSSDGTKLIAASIAGVYTSTNSGVNWTSNNVGVMVAVASSADGSKLAAVAKGGGIYLSQAAPAPLLDVSRLATHLTISWIVPANPFRLQQNAGLNPTNWEDVPTTPTFDLTNLQYQLSVFPSKASSFYRLKHTTSP